MLIDNAPSHIWKHEDYPNLEIIPLPPNTTSKLQPLDAGIIASLKCQIWKQQLEHTLDILDHENWDNLRPYKVDQLTAMRWARNAWRNMKSTVIQNCWKHTGLLSVPVPPEAENSPSENTDHITSDFFIDEAVTENYERFIQRANIHDAMNIRNFLNPVEEEEILREIKLIDEEELILQTAVTVQIDEEQQAAEAEASNIALYSDMSRQEELGALAKAIAVYEKHEHPQHETRNIVGALRALQRQIRQELDTEGATKLTQTSIRQYLG